MKWITLDLSLRKCGVAVWENGELLKYERIDIVKIFENRTEQKWNTIKKTDRWIKTLMILKEHYGIYSPPPKGEKNPQLVIIEKTNYHLQGATAIALAQTYAGCKVYYETKDVKVLDIHARSLANWKQNKMIHLGQVFEKTPSFNKDIAIRIANLYVTKEYPDKPIITDDDTADAICIGLMAIEGGMIW